MIIKNIMKSCQNSYLWIHLWIYAIEFMIMKSYMNSYYESMCEFSVMKNIVKSWLNSSLSQAFTEFPYEIIVEFIKLKYIQIQLQVCFSEGKCFTHLKLSSPLLCSQLTVSPQAAVRLLLGGDRAALLQQQTSGAAHTRAGRTQWAFQAHDGRHWHQDLLGLIVSNKGNFRNLQVERYLRQQPQGHYPHWAIRSSERFQAGEGRWEQCNA